jgi:DNA-binding CsgD family transcriptional regulator
MGKISPCVPHHATILAWLAEGISMTSIARRLELPAYVVKSYLSFRNIRHPQGRNFPRKVNEQAMKVLLTAGHTYAHIAQVLGVSRSAIERRVRALGLPRRRTGPQSCAGHREWLGGRRMDKYGYILIYAPLHPHARRPGGAVAEHRLLMEVVRERYLLPTEVVNHLDNHPFHNWPENLDLYASNADHLRAELTGRVKATPRQSIPGAYGSNQKIAHCPDEAETLAQCPLALRQKLAWYIESHRPTLAHQSRSRRVFLREGAWRPPFQWASME